MREGQDDDGGGGPDTEAAEPSLEPVRQLVNGDSSQQGERRDQQQEILLAEIEADRRREQRHERQRHEHPCHRSKVAIPDGEDGAHGGQREAGHARRKHHAENIGKDGETVGRRADRRVRQRIAHGPEPEPGKRAG